MRIDAETGTLSVPNLSTSAAILDSFCDELGRATKSKVAGFKAKARKSEALRKAFWDQEQAAVARRTDIDLQISHLKREIDQKSVNAHDGNARLKELESDRATVVSEIDQIRIDARDIPNPPDVNRLLSELLQYGRRFRASVPDVSLRKGQTPSQAVEQTRNEIRDVNEGIKKAKLAPLPVEDAIASIVAEIERKAAMGTPHFGRASLVDPERALAGRYIQGTIRMPTRYDGTGTGHFDPEHYTYWRDKELLIAAAKEQVKARPGALSIAARKKRVEELERLKLTLERKEEVYVSMCEAQGLAVSRRADASPMAVLGLEVDTRPLRKPVTDVEPEYTAEEQAGDLKRQRLRDVTVRSKRPARMSAAEESEFG